MDNMYSDRFNKFILFILKEECDWPNDKSGEFTDDPDDNGSATRFGIDLTSYKKDHPLATKDTIRNLTYDDAVDIYWRDYWTKHNIESISYPMGECMMNTFVNGGYALEWQKQSNNDASNYVDLQEKYYYNLCDYWERKGKKNPRKYLSDWIGRCNRLKEFLKLN